MTANNDDIIRRQAFEQEAEGDSNAPTSRGYVHVAESERERRFREELAEIEATYSQALSDYHVRKGMLYKRAAALGARLPWDVNL